MKAAFRVQTSLRADIEIGDDATKKTILTQAVRFAESLDIEGGEYAILNVAGKEFGVNGCDFKVVVRLAPREIHIITEEEAHESGLMQLKTEPGGGH